MPEVVELRHVRDQVDEGLMENLSTRLATLLAAAIVEDTPIRTDLLLAELQTVVAAVGLAQATVLLRIVWSTQGEQIEDFLATALRELKEAGHFGDTASV